MKIVPGRIVRPLTKIVFKTRLSQKIYNFMKNYVRIISRKALRDLWNLASNVPYLFKVSYPPSREFSLTSTLPKCLSFLRKGGKVKEVISRVFGVVDYESEVRISKFKMADPIFQ